MRYLRDKIKSLESSQLGAILVILGKMTLEEIKELETDCNQLVGLDPSFELHKILINELYHTLTSEELELPSELIKLEPVDYMSAIHEACGR